MADLSDSEMDGILSQALDLYVENKIFLTQNTFSFLSEDQTVISTGVSDSERCYYDRGRLTNWEHGQMHMEEHVRWSPGNSEFFADGAFNPGDSYIESVAAQSCLDMGFSRESVESAISIFLQRYGKFVGNSDFKGADLCEILFEIEEAKESKTAESTEDMQEDSSLTQNQVCKLCVASLDHLSFVAFNHVLCCPQCYQWFRRLSVN